MTELMRVQKFLSRAGVCSRRKAEEHMLDGRIKINGKICRELGTKVTPGKDNVEFDDKNVSINDRHVYILLNKPPNYITTLDDPKGRPTVVDLLPDKLPRIWPVGRLDFDSEGLLILTDDGKLTNLITHPSHDLTKTYAVKARGLLDNSAPELERLRQGIRIEGGYKTRPASVSVTKDNGRNTWLKVVISEGKNRQVRRMFDAIRYPVMTLRRIAIGTVHIKGLSSGAHRPMTYAEVSDLYDLVGEEMPQRAIPSDREMATERKLIKMGKLPDHDQRKYDLFDLED